MKSSIRSISVLLTAIIIVLSMAAVAYADELSGTEYPYGVYEPNTFNAGKADGGESRVTITCPRIHVTSEITADIVISSKNYTKLEVDGKEYAPVKVDETAKTTTFRIPVKLGETVPFKGTTVAMSSEQTIDYVLLATLDGTNLKPVTRGALTDGFYTTVVNTNMGTYGYSVDKEGKVTRGLSNPKGDYDLSVTMQIADGKIADVAYTLPVLDTVANTSSDINYLIWAMDGHHVTEDTNYAYLAASGKNYEKYNIDPKPAPNGKGMKDQIIAKNGTTGVDTVTAATVTSRAIIDSVDKSLDKAEQGLKDDPEPVLPGPDTTEDIVPADGDYTVKAETLGFSLSNEKDILLHVEKGKMTIKYFYTEQRQSSYPYIYSGTEKEALDAGDTAWLLPVDYDGGYRGSKNNTLFLYTLYKDVPVKSLDKANNFVMFSGGSKNWFNRHVTLKSETLRELSAEEVSRIDKEAEFDIALAEVETAIEQSMGTAEAIKLADQLFNSKEAMIEAGQTNTAAIEAKVTEAEAKIAELEVQVKQVKSVKAKAGKKKATVSWKKLGSGYKYEVYVSTKINSGFKKKATTSKLKSVVKKLKSKKTYYVRVRGVKKVNGKNVYTAYSDLAKVKVK